LIGVPTIGRRVAPKEEESAQTERRTALKEERAAQTGGRAAPK